MSAPLKQSAPQPSPRRRVLPPAARRALAFLLGAAILSIATTVALRQEPRADAFAPPPTAWTSQEWWTHPIERNAFLRLPRTNEDFSRIFVLPGTRQVWIASASRLILHSSDGGQTWERQEVPLPPASSAPVTLTTTTQTIPTKSATTLSLDISGPAANLPQSVVTTDPMIVRSGITVTSIVFTDPRHGWAAGGLAARGLLWETQDGGKMWTVRTEVDSANQPFTDLAFHGNAGAVIGDAAVYLTNDGGKNWTVNGRTGVVSGAYSPSGELQFVGSDGKINGAYLGNEVRHLRYLDATHLAVENDAGTLLSSDGGRTWKLAAPVGTMLVLSGGKPAKIPLPARDIKDAVMLDAANGFAAGVWGALFKTTNGGRTWTRAAMPLDLVQTIIASTDGKYVCAAGEGGLTLFSSDSGRTFISRPAGRNQRITAMATIGNGSTAWVGGWNSVLKTVDGGRHWESAAPAPSGQVIDLRVTDDGSFAIATTSERVRRHIYTSIDGGATWKAPRLVDYQQTSFSDGLNGAVVLQEGPDLVLYRTDDGTATLTRIKVLSPLFKIERPGPLPADSITLQFANDGLSGWLGEFNSLPQYTTTNGGRSWKPLPKFAREIDEVTLAPDGAHGFAHAKDGAILATSNGGQEWVPLSSQHFSVATMAFAGNILWSTADGGIPVRSTDWGRTWKKSEYSRWPAPWLWPALLLAVPFFWLAFRPQAAVAVMRSIEVAAASDNPVTNPAQDRLGFPDLADGVARFLGNAATEPPLTIAITGRWGSGKSSLMNLIDEGVQRFGHCTAWFNAWHYQSEEHLLPAIIESLEREALPRWWTAPGLLFRVRLLFMRLNEWVRRGTWFGAAAALVYYGVSKLRPNLDPATLAGWSAALAAAFSILKTVDAFGVTPAKITEVLKPRPRAGDPGFRHEFASRLRQVERALGERHHIVLFIDDLDRCRPEHVMSILETVNFLVSSARCFIIIGMDLDRVERTIAMRFEEEAKKLGDATDGGAIRAYARNYLEKLVNVEVPVPVATEEASRNLFADRRPKREDDAAEGRRASVAKWIRHAQHAAGYAACLLLLAGVWRLALVSNAETPAVPEASAIAPETETAATTTTTTTATTATAPPKTETAAPAADPEPVLNPYLATSAYFAPGTPFTTNGWLYLGIGFAILTGLFVFRITADRPRHEEDSDSFRKTLVEWHPLIFAASATPRSMKRCINRVRYYAMRIRTNPLPAYWNERIARRWVPTEEKETPPAIPDDVLVPLGIIQHVCPQWTGLDAFWNETETFFNRKPLPFVLRHPARELARRSIASYRAAFDEISRGIAIAGTDEEDVEAKLRSHFGGATA